MSLDYGNNFIFENLYWTQLKAVAAHKGLVLQYSDDAVVGHRDVFAIDGVLVHRCRMYLGPVLDAEVYSQEQNDADLADFESSSEETSNRSSLPRNSAGLPIVANSAFCHVDQRTRFNGFRYVAEPGAITIFDEEITTQIYVQGGRATIDNVVDGDMVEFAVVDVDNVLGLHTAYGLTPGVDVIELDKYVRTVYPRAPSDDMEHRVASAAAVTAGLHLRIIYHAVAGGAPRLIKPTILWYEG